MEDRLENEKELYIPMGIRTEKEILDGFEQKHFLLACMGIGIAIVVAFVYYLIFNDSVTAVLLFSIGGFISYFLFQKNDLNVCFVELIGFSVRYIKSQKVFYYKYQDEWEEK